MRQIKVLNEIPEGLSKDEIDWVYNGFDCVVTNELFFHLDNALSEKDTRITYEFSKAMVAPALDMMYTGWVLDEKEISNILWSRTGFRRSLERLSGMGKDHKGKGYVKDDKAAIQKICFELCGRTINVNSPIQLRQLLYEDLAIPVHYRWEKGQRKVSTNREALELISAAYPRARLFCKLLLRIRDIEKKISVLESERDADGRLRSFYNVVGTETGRWTSKANAFGRGTNLNNITKDLRAVFVPEEGHIMFNADLKSAESIAVGYLSGDEAYIKACLSGDIHTSVAKIIWPNYPWTNVEEEDIALASSTPFYLHHTLRQLAKRGGHGSNYGGTAKTMASHLKIEESIMHLFRALYLGGEISIQQLTRWRLHEYIEKADDRMGNMCFFNGAFPGIAKWQTYIRQTLQKEERLTTPLGRRRIFWNRTRDDATVREAIAFVPQSVVADILNIGLFNLWKLSKEEKQLTLSIFGQVYDSITGQIPLEFATDNTKQLISNTIKVTCPVTDINGITRDMTIPVGTDFGSNWKEAS